MNDKSDLFGRPYGGDSFDPEEKQLNLNPIKFLELEKQKILTILISESGYSHQEASGHFKMMKDILLRLKPLRTSRADTDKFLKEIFAILRRDSKLMIIIQLLRATATCDTWCYAYNMFVAYINRILILNFPRKEFSELDLQLDIELEKRAERQEIPDTTNPLVFDKTLLNAFYLAFDGFLWKHSSHDDFINWFRVYPAGRPVFKEGMTSYFCYAVGKIEDRMLGLLRPKNLNRWIGPVINGSNYSAMKKRVSNKRKIAEINNRLAMF